MQFTYTNRLMDECLRELESYWSDEKTRLRGDVLRFAGFIMADVVCHQGCYILRSDQAEWDVDPDGEFIPDHIIPDRSGYEDFANHHHAREFITSNEPSIGFLAVGLALAEILHLKLRQNFPTVHFRISAGFPVKPLNLDDDQIRNDCRVSFHAVREGEVIFENLENFRHDAMGILEF
jgi:hypothetical protein